MDKANLLMLLDNKRYCLEM